MAFEDEIEAYEPPQVDDGIEGYEPPKAKIHPVKPKKPSKRVGPPPSDREPISTFRGTPLGPMTGSPTGLVGEQGPRISGVPSLEEIGKRQAARKRAIVPTKPQFARMTPEEKLRLAQERSSLGVGPTGVARPETPEEFAKTRAISEEQELYDKLGPAAYAARQGFFGIFSPVVKPSKSMVQGISSVPAQTEALLEGDIEKIKKIQKANLERTEFDASREIVKDSQDPLRLYEALPTAIELAGQYLLTKGAGARTPELPPIEELGTTARIPRQLGPGRVIEGAPPVRPTPPSPPQAPLQLRQGRTIVGFPPAKPPVRPTYLPPGPNDLARLSPGRMGPMWDMGALSTFPPRLGGEAEDMNFDLLPALHPGQAPVMLTPGWIVEAAAGKPVGGVNILFKDVPRFKNTLITQAPTKTHLSEALFQIEELVKASKEEGLDTISLVNREVNKGQVIPHETFHAGQAELAPSVFEVHDPEWARNHPAIQDILKSKPMIRSEVAAAGNERSIEDILAAELPAYVMGGQSKYYFKTSGEGIDFLFDYLNHIIERKGAEAIDTLQKTARIRPEIEDALPLARSMYDTWQRERAERNLQQIPGGGEYGGAGPGLSPVTAGGLQSGGGEARITPPGGEAPGTIGVSARPTRELALEHGLKDPPIVRHRRTAAAIEENLPLVEEGMTRLWRGNRPEEIGVNPQFTNDLPGIALPFSEMYEGGISYVDVPTDQLGQYEQRYGSAPGAEFILPPELASKAVNVEIFDPIRPEMSLSTRPPVNEGDLVKVKGYSNNAEVTKMLPGGGVEVKFPDGTTDEFDFDQVTKIVPKATPKVQESNETRKALVENPIVNVNIGESLPGIDAPVRKEADIGFPPPTQPPLEGMGSGLPPLRRKIISPEVNEALVRAFTSLMEAGGVKPNPLIPPFLQVRQAVLDGKIAGKELGRLLEENNITADEFADEWAETASVAGTILSELSRIENDQAKIVELMKKDPQLAKTLFPAKQRMEAILREIETTQLGKSFWQRAGDMMQQMMLSDIRIAVRNAIVTTARIPVVGFENMTGAWLKAVVEGKYKGKTLEQMIEAAKNDAMIGLEVASEMISAFKPPSLKQMMISGQSAKRMKYDEAITQLQKSFPQLHRELVTPGFGPEVLERGKESVDIARDVINEMRVDVKRRDEFVKRLDKAERRLQSNIKGLGRVLNAMGYPLDQILRPTNWAEMFFRQPAFYGHLKMRMHLEGQDLAQIIRDEKFDEIPEDMLKDAVDEALYVTHAYMPRAERGRMESAARGMVMALNKIKLAAPFTQQWFPRALYTGLKFAYEYVPLTPLIGGVPFGAIKPAMRVMRSQSATDPKTGKKIPVDPATFRDYKRLGGALIGTVLYGIAEWLRSSEFAGPEWYQVDTGKKGKTGEPLYWDLRGYYPLALFVQIADLNRRMRNKLMGDMEWGKELKESISGMSKSPETEEWVTSMGKMWGGEENGLWEKTQVGIGRQFSFTTKSFAMLRDGYAAFSDEENKRKDLKGSGIMGPLIDNVPWLRGKYLPNVESMTGPESPKLSEYPGTTFLGARFTEGENFAGREWRRLGLFNRRFMDPDPDPIINRAQNEYFRIAVTALGKVLEGSDFYKKSSDEDKAAIWEIYVLDDDGIADQARERGAEANPIETQKNEILRESGMGPLQIKASKLKEKLEKALPKK